MECLGAASDRQCQSRNRPGFDPTNLRHSGIRGAAHEAVLNEEHNKITKILLFKSSETNTMSESRDIKTHYYAKNFCVVGFLEEKSTLALASLGRTPGRVGPRVVTACFTATYLGRGHPRGPVHSPGGSYPLLYWWGPPLPAVWGHQLFCDF